MQDVEDALEPRKVLQSLRNKTTNAGSQRPWGPLDNPCKTLVEEDIVSILLDVYCVRQARISPTHQLKDHETRTGAGHLTKCTPRKPAEEPGPPPPGSRGLAPAPFPGLLVRMIV